MKYFILLGLVLASAPISANSPVEQALELCRAEQNTLRRLACYDNISLVNANSPEAADSTASTKHTTIGTASAAASRKSATTVVETDSEANFGIEHTKVIEDAPEQLYMTVATVNYSPRKKLIVTFSNGQVWRQSDTANYKIAVGESHYIKRGVLNSFFLGNDQNNRTIRVKREK